MVELVDEAHHGGWQSEARVSLSYALLALDDIAGAEATAEQAVDMVAADDIYTVASARRRWGWSATARVESHEAGPLFEASWRSHGPGLRTERPSLTARWPSSSSQRRDH